MGMGHEMERKKGETQGRGKKCAPRFGLGRVRRLAVIVTAVAAAVAVFPPAVVVSGRIP
jgi:hypothetical protein